MPQNRLDPLLVGRGVRCKPRLCLVVVRVLLGFKCLHLEVFSKLACHFFLWGGVEAHFSFSSFGGAVSHHLAGVISLPGPGAGSSAAAGASVRGAGHPRARLAMERPGGRDTKVCPLTMVFERFYWGARQVHHDVEVLFSGGFGIIVRSCSLPCCTQKRFCPSLCLFRKRSGSFFCSTRRVLRQPFLRKSYSEPFPLRGEGLGFLDVLQNPSVILYEATGPDKPKNTHTTCVSLILSCCLGLRKTHEPNNAGETIRLHFFQVKPSPGLSRFWFRIWFRCSFHWGHNWLETCDPFLRFAIRPQKPVKSQPVEANKTLGPKGAFFSAGHVTSMTMLPWAQSTDRLKKQLHEFLGGCPTKHGTFPSATSSSGVLHFVIWKGLSAHHFM